jgi:hypothetical protein
MNSRTPRPKLLTPPEWRACHFSRECQARHREAAGIDERV